MLKAKSTGLSINMPLLGVNIDHIATIRQIRSAVEPEPVYAAYICESNGADSIVAHLREDQRHINDRDVFLLKRAVKTRFNLEMSANPGIVEIACRLKPDQATLVPERRLEITTEGGLDVVKYGSKIRRVVDKLKSTGIEVSLFIDPVKRQIDAAKKAGVNVIELHTGAFAENYNSRKRNFFLKEIIKATDFAMNEGLIVNAGHGLDYHNVQEIARIRGITELNIGYAIVCRAALAGLAVAVRQMKELIVCH